MNKFVVAFLLALSTSAIAQPEQPKPQCFARAQITKPMMAEGGSPVFVGPVNADVIFEIWSNGKRWTAFHTRRDGQMCIVSRGDLGIGMAPPICIDPVKCPSI